jgi:hypothetical protein
VSASSSADFSGLTDHSVLEIGCRDFRHDGLVAHPGIAPVRADDEPGLDLAPVLQLQMGGFVVDPELRTLCRLQDGEVLLLAQSLPQGMLQQAAFEDEGQFGRADLVGGKIQLGAGVAEHAHLLHLLHARHVQPLPGAKLLEEFHIAGGERVDTTVPAGIEAGQGLAFDQGDLQPAGFER